MREQEELQGRRAHPVSYTHLDVYKRQVDKQVAEVDCKGKIRTVFLTNGLCRLLKAYARKRNIISGMIFVTRSGKPMDRSNIWREMKQISHKAGVNPDKVFPHNLRHLFARVYYSCLLYTSRCV